MSKVSTTISVFMSATTRQQTLAAAPVAIQQFLKAGATPSDRVPNPYRAIVASGEKKQAIVTHQSETDTQHWVVVTSKDPRQVSLRVVGWRDGGLVGGVRSVL